MNLQSPEQLRSYVEEDVERFERMLLPVYLYNRSMVGQIENSIGHDYEGKEVEDFSKPPYQALFAAMREYHQLTNYGFFPNPSFPAIQQALTRLVSIQAGRFAITEDMIGPAIADLTYMAQQYCSAWEYTNDLVKRGFYFWLEERRLALMMGRRRSQHWTVSKFSDEWAQEQTHVRNLSGAANSIKLWHSIDDCMSVEPVEVFLQTPWPALNERIGGGWARGDATLIVGASGAGKTVVACQIAAHLALKQRAKGVFISTEQKGPGVYPRMVSCYAGVPYKELSHIRSARLDRIDTKYHNDMLLLREKLNLAEFYFRDWAPGDNITTGLRGIVQFYKERVSSDGRIDFIVMDWVGGTVIADHVDEADKRNKMQLAADTIAFLADELQIVTIATAQANTKQGSNKAAVGASDLKDNKSLHHHFENCFGISVLVDGEIDTESQEVQARFCREQFINIDKGRFGAGGLVPVRRNYEYQRLDNNFRSSA